MPVEVFTRLLLILIGLGMAANIIWRVAKRLAADGENLITLLWKDYKEGLHWLLHRRWILNLLLLGVMIGPLITCLVFLREDHWFQSRDFGLLDLSEWARHLSTHFIQRWLFTYILSPLGAIRPLMQPFQYSTALAAILAVVSGLWLFRFYTAKVQAHEELLRGIEWFKKTINVTTVLAGFVLTGFILFVVLEEDVYSLISITGPDTVVYWVCLPLSVLAMTIYAALFTSAILGSFRSHLDGVSCEKPSLEAFRFYRPLFTFGLWLALIVILLARIIPYFLSMIVKSYPQIAGWHMWPIASVLMNFLFLTVILVPAAIVADGVSPRAAIKRNLAVWRTRPIQMIVAVAFFMAVAFSIDSAFTLITSPLSPSWIIINILRSFIRLLLQTSILLGVYRFYRRISERGTVDHVRRTSVSLPIAGSRHRTPPV